MSTAAERKEKRRQAAAEWCRKLQGKPATVFIGTTSEAWKQAVVRLLQRRKPRPKIEFDNSISDEQISHILASVQ